MRYLPSVVLSVGLCCGLLINTLAAEPALPWPVVGVARVFVDVGGSNAVRVLVGEPAALFVVVPGGVGAWHLWPAGTYSLDVGGAPYPVEVAGGQTVGILVTAGGGVSVFQPPEDSGTSVTETKWFWGGFAFVFVVGLVGLGTKWSGRIMAGGHHLNE